MRQQICIRLDAGQLAHIRQLTGLSAGPGATSNVSIEQLARPISATHPKYGPVVLTQRHFDSFIRNFNGNVYGQAIQLDRDHNPGAGVGGKFRRLFMDGERFCGELEWTDFGRRVFHDDGFIYLSIDYTENYKHPETGVEHGPLLFGVALCPRPFIKNMTPSEGPGRWLLSDGHPQYVPDYLPIEGEPMKKYAALLKSALEAKKLSATLVGILVSQFEHQAAALQLSDTDEAGLKKLSDELAASVEPPAAASTVQLSESKIAEIVQKTLSDQAAAAAKKAQGLEVNRKAFTDAINGAKGLSDFTRQGLLEGLDLVTGDMPPEQVKRFAEQQIELGNRMEVAAKKSALGLAPAGFVHVVPGADGIGSKVHGFLREQLALSDSAHELRLPEEKSLTPFARKILAAFDRQYGAQMEAEFKRLSGDGSVVITDGQFPVVAQREVIVELLADLKFLDLVATKVDTTSQSTMQIPYEVRNVANVGPGAVVYEGQPINYAGVSQLMDQAFCVPRKIAAKMSNEMIHFSRNALINWDAWARSIASNSRLMRDIIAAALANEMLRASDSFAAVPVANEALTAQVNGVRNTFKTANFPVVRPFTPRNLQGVAVGTPQNPITVTLGGTPLLPYDYSGTQAAGNYWLLSDPNLGLFRIVNQAGVVQTPANATTLVVSYDYATNLLKFDIDVPGGVDYDKHLNGLLRAIGRRKATLNQERFVQVQYGICSATLHNTISEAEQFDRDSERPGNGLGGDGSLSQVKGIPMWSSNQPGVDLGDARLLIGEARTTTYGISKPFATGAPFEVMDPSTMKPTGEKQAYGEEYSTIHTPLPLKNRHSSVLVYSSTARTAI